MITKKRYRLFPQILLQFALFVSSLVTRVQPDTLLHLPPQPVFGMGRHSSGCGLTSSSQVKRRVAYPFFAKGIKMGVATQANGATLQAIAVRRICGYRPNFLPSLISRPRQAHTAPELVSGRRASAPIARRDITALIRASPRPMVHARPGITAL